MKAYGLNNYFDTKLPILESMYDEACTHGGELSDQKFDQCCREYGMKEDKVMELMVKSAEYDFGRTGSGWTVNKS